MSSPRHSLPSLPTIPAEWLVKLGFFVLLIHQLEMVGRLEFAFVGVSFAALGLIFGERRIALTAGGVAAVGIIEIAVMPWNVPNHLVVATALACGMALSGLEAGDRRPLLRSDQAAALVFVVFFFATVQKLTSPLWMNGSYPALMVHLGGFGHDIWSQTGLGGVIASNREAHEWAQSGVIRGSLRPVPGGVWATWVIVVGTLVIEAAVLVLVAFRNRWSDAFGAAMGVFLVGTALVRAEFVFLGLVAALTAWTLTERPHWRTFFIVLSAVLNGVWLARWVA